MRARGFAETVSAARTAVASETRRRERGAIGPRVCRSRRADGLGPESHPDSPPLVTSGTEPVRPGDEGATRAPSRKPLIDFATGATRRRRPEWHPEESDLEMDTSRRAGPGAMKGETVWRRASYLSRVLHLRGVTAGSLAKRYAVACETSPTLHRDSTLVDQRGGRKGKR